MTARCIWYYHDGGKSCETCECPAQVELRKALARYWCSSGCGRQITNGPRLCWYCKTTKAKAS